MTVVDESPQDAGQQDTTRQDATTAFDALIDKVRAEFDTAFTWDYERSRDGLNRLYETVSYTHLRAHET